jgi:hypothetical protein
MDVLSGPDAARRAPYRNAVFQHLGPFIEISQCDLVAERHILQGLELELLVALHEHGHDFLPPLDIGHRDTDVISVVVYQEAMFHSAVLLSNKPLRA